MTAILLFIKDNWKEIVVILLLVATYIWADHNGAARIQDKWDKVNLEAEIKARGIELQGNNVTNGVEYDLQKRFNVITGTYDTNINRLFTANGNMSKNGSTPGSGNATTCRTGLPRQNKQALLKLAELADIQTAQLVACQQWITKQEAIYGH